VVGEGGGGGGGGGGGEKKGGNLRPDDRIGRRKKRQGGAYLGLAHTPFSTPERIRAARESDEKEDEKNRLASTAGLKKELKRGRRVGGGQTRNTGEQEDFNGG